MISVTQKIKEVKQPYGGYLNPKEFKVIEKQDEEVLGEETISGSLVGLAVDYLTRLMLNNSTSSAFKISMSGASMVMEVEKAQNLLNNIKGLDDNSIISACKLVGYDACARSGLNYYTNVDKINPDSATINNIRIMVNRTLSFFQEYGPVIRMGESLNNGNVKGDYDYLTNDTLWDLKVSKTKPTSQNTLQLLSYYMIGKQLEQKEISNITKLGIFNPRENCIYIKNINEISSDVMNAVLNDVIGTCTIAKKEENNNDLLNSDQMLSMEEIMKVLKCRRHMVMKYYAEEHLPLVRINHQYYIEKMKLFIWMQEMDVKRKAKSLYEDFVLGILITIGILLILVMFT